MKAAEDRIQELLVGDAAPPLAVQEFLKGEPVFELVPGDVYVVELWASWCGACIGCIPLLTKLQEQYPQVKVIGVSVKDPDLEKVRTLVAGRSDNIGYRIAIEKTREQSASREGGEMARRWFDASYSLGLPEAFIVDKAGKIAWMGHPGQLDEPLAKIVNGKWDIGAAAAAHEDALARRRVRERKRVYEKLEAHYLAGESAAALGIIKEAVAENPDLELEFGHYRLRLLMREQEANQGAILDYAKRMMDIVGEAKVEPSRRWSELTGIAIALSQFDSKEVNDDPTLADPDLAAVAVQAMLLAGEIPYEQEMGPQLNSHMRLLHEAFFVHALMGNGQMRAARERGERILGETDVEAMGNQNAELVAAMRMELDAMRRRVEQCKRPGPT
jgi:thiol-disulfide isomerase/thioredoxin